MNAPTRVLEYAELPCLPNFSVLRGPSDHCGVLRVSQESSVNEGVWYPQRSCV